MTLTIAGLGTAVPETLVDPDDALRIGRMLASPTPLQESWLPRLYAGAGIRNRRMVLPAGLLHDIAAGTNDSGSVFLSSGASGRGPSTRQRMEHYADLAPPLALRACRQAMTAAGTPGSAFTHLITVSCTGFFAPGIDRQLIEELDLPPTTQRTHIGFMGCHGALNGLRVARGLTAAEPTARVLLCAVELCSLHCYYGWNPALMLGNALFGDGSAALVGAPAGDGPAWRVAASGSCLIPDSADAMSWTVGDHGFEMTLGKNVPGLIARNLRPWLESWLREQGLGLDEVRSWAVHPGGPRILTAVEEGLELPADALSASRAVFAEYGNMSSPTVLFILHRLRAQGAHLPCVMLGFGPGLAAEAALLR